MRELLARDKPFRDYQTAMSVFGAGNLALMPLLIVCLNEVLGLPAFMQVLVTTALPVLVVPFAIQPWARYLDRHRVLAFRAVHGRVNVAAMALLVAAVLLQQSWLLLPGALLMGVSTAGGQSRVDAGSQRFRAARRRDALHGAARNVDRHARSRGAAAHDRRSITCWSMASGLAGLRTRCCCRSCSWSIGARRFQAMHRAQRSHRTAGVTRAPATRTIVAL